MDIESEELWGESANTDTCREWQNYIADIMGTNPYNSPVSVDLEWFSIWINNIRGESS